MSDKPRRAKRGGWAVLALGLVLVLLLAGYVASSGPVARLVVDGRLNMTTYRTVYAPIGLGERQCQLFHSAISRYRCLFVDSRQWTLEELKWRSP
jgi:hypothetical protein